MRKLFILAGWSALGVLATAQGCSNSTNEQGIATQATETSGDASSDASADCEASADGSPSSGGGSGGAIEFTTFVRQLIEKETADNNFATTIDDKTFVDSENPNAFPPAFFNQQ